MRQVVQSVSFRSSFSSILFRTRSSISCLSSAVSNYRRSSRFIWPKNLQSIFSPIYHVKSITSPGRIVDPEIATLPIGPHMCRETVFFGQQPTIECHLLSLFTYPVKGLQTDLINIRLVIQPFQPVGPDSW